MKQKLGKALITELKQQTHDRTAIAKFEKGDAVYYLTGWNTKYDLPKGYCVEPTGYGDVCTIDKYDLQFATRDKKFQKRWMVSIKIEKEFKSYLDSKAQETEEQERLLQEQLKAEEEKSYPLTPEETARVEAISNEHLLNEFELLRIEEQDNEAALIYEAPEDEWIIPIEQDLEETFIHNVDVENELAK